MFLKKIIGFFQRANPSKVVKPENDKKYKTGIVQFINHSKRYGFIKSKQTSKDVYVNFADTIDKIYPGDKVKFLVEKNDKGLRAKEVVVL